MSSGPAVSCDSYVDLLFQQTTTRHNKTRPLFSFVYLAADFFGPKEVNFLDGIR